MLIDRKLVFCDAQAITASAASTNPDSVAYLDFGVADPNMGDGTPLMVRFICEESFTKLTNLTFALQHDSDSAFGTAEVLAQFTRTLAQLTKGAYIQPLAIPEQHERYLRIYFTVSGTTPDAGKITAFIDPVM